MGIWGDEIFENDYALSWLATFGYKLQPIIRSTVYEMKNNPYKYISGFEYGFVIPIYMHWILFNKITEHDIAPPHSAELEYWISDFNLWWHTAITDEMRTSKPDYYKQIYEFTAHKLDRMLAYARDFEDEDFSGAYNRDEDIGHLPKFEDLPADYYDFTFFILSDLSNSLERFVTSSFYENNLSFESGDWQTSQTEDSYFMAALKVLYLFRRYCRYVADDGNLTQSHYLFKKPKAYILEQWKDSYLEYLKKSYSEAEIKEDNYFQVRIGVFDKFIQFAQEFEQLKFA